MNTEELFKYPSLERMRERMTRRKRAAPSTVNGYAKSVHQFASFMGFENPETLLKHIKEKENREELLDNWVGDILRGKSDTSSERIMKGVKKWLICNKVEVDWDLVEMPVYGGKIIEDRIPRKEELRALVDIGNLRDKAMILTALSSGLRINTLRTLTWGEANFDIDPDLVMFKINNMPGRKLTKKKVFYVTFATKEAREKLLEYKKYREEQGENITPKSPLFTSTKDGERGKLLSERYLSVHWGRLLKRTHLSEKCETSFSMKGGQARWYVLHFHTLRKFFETACISCGVKPSFHRFWTGHRGSDADYEWAYFLPRIPEHIAEYKKVATALSLYGEDTEKALRLEKSLNERDSEIKRLNMETEGLKAELETYKAKVNGFEDRESHIQKMVERMERMYRQTLEAQAKSENPEIRYHAERELKELEEEGT